MDRIPPRSPSRAAAVTVALVSSILAGGLLLRSLRLDWQPLWWDEGYSIYFATEPLARMVWLTARDIHPPLYYALLHTWLSLWGNSIPTVARALSVLLGWAALPLVYWLARLLFPDRRRIAVVGLLLLAVNPMHLFYSQEVRMYGLAMALGVASTACFWLLVCRLDKGEPMATALPGWPALGYIAFAVAGLYTLYYTALLLLAHLVWAGLIFRQRGSRLWGVVGLDAIVALAYAPWLAYAVPKLVGYVGNKVAADQDLPLAPLTYWARHITAFVGGHLQSPAAPAGTNLLLALLALLVLVGATGRQWRSMGRGAGALWFWLLVPCLVGWLVNLRLPFFPEGGERLLLIVLPYFCLLLALGIERTWSTYHLGKVALALLLGSAMVGVATFYTLPRYDAHDYRPIIRQIVQQAADDDTVLAIFPWQVGYWRAYAPLAEPEFRGPELTLLADDIVGWSPAVQHIVDRALSRGALWFPEPLTFGSTLPNQLEAYLRGVAINLENRWYDATRLTAWAQLAPAPMTYSPADFGPVQLVQAGIAPTHTVSANQPVAVTLQWQSRVPVALNLSVRLRDGAGRIWASREAAAPWAAALAPGANLTETLGLIVPVGLPPGEYEVAASLVESSTAGLAPLTVAGNDAVDASIGWITVAEPMLSQPLARLPVRDWLAEPVVVDGLALVGYTGPALSVPHLAGTQLDLRLFLQNRAELPPVRQLYVSLLDGSGQAVAGYEGWPLPDYPTSAWPPGALVQTPVTFFTPGTLPSGGYKLIAGFVEPSTGVKSAPIGLGTLQVVQRQALFDHAAPAIPLAMPAQFGTHGRLLGYAVDWTETQELTLQLYWEILQPLLPPHHIFVHGDGLDGTTVAQADGPPRTAAGPAPTGSWQAGEFLVTEHRLSLSTEVAYALRVGLYDPVTGVRLPVTVDGQAAGDNVIIPLGRKEE